MPDRLTTATIHLNHYTTNLAYVRSLVGPQTQILAVVKANAYGHGLEEIAHEAVRAGVSYFGVACLGEVKRMRAAGIQTPVLIMNYLDPDSIREAVSVHSSFTAMDMGFLVALKNAAHAAGMRAKVHLKIDTGLHRAGCDAAEALKLAQFVRDSSELELEGVFTHFAEAEDQHTAYTEHQLTLFTNCLKEFDSHGIRPPLIHAANSAAIIAHPSSHFTMVRPGIITYGLNPFPQDSPLFESVASKLNPVLTLKSQIAHVRQVPPGEGVGYNLRWKAARQSVIALVPIGYGDGLRRAPHHTGHMLVQGHAVPVVGTIAMDYTLLDVTELHNPTVGDEVVIIGREGELQRTAADIAQECETIHYDIVTSISSRVARICTSGS
ncbi:MAG: alanine racemase [Candidatus Saccharimonadales bacterium]|jgi:alanine racemase